MMRSLLGIRLNACGVMLALILTTGWTAEEAPLVGATRDQVLARFGEPRSQIVAGNREVMFFARDRVVLRDGIVVEAEKLPVETPRAAPTPPPAQPDVVPSGASAPQDAAPAPGATTAPGAAAQQPAGSTGVANLPAAKPVQPETPPASAEPKFEIKSVRPPGSRSIPRSTTPSEPVTSTPASPEPVPPAPTTTQPEKTIPASAKATAHPAASTSAVNTHTPNTALVVPHHESAVATVALTPEPEPTKAEEPSAPETEKTAPKKKTAQRHRSDAEPDIPNAADIISTRGNWLIAMAVTGIGVGYLVWRYRQRQLALVATAVSRTPFAAPVAAKGGAMFNAELLQKLEWKRFEEIVAAYYSKTGVVAMRTKAGPNAPVHIKISWKGESRPFAYVQCIAQPPGLIDAKPLQELVNALTADDIRRGYVVSTGKFNVSARDLAEEKHITLLPGDIFLEKLNALPDAARAELMQQITSGDYSTPTCPKCEARMVRAPDDPMMWRCPVHPDQQIPARS